LFTVPKEIFLTRGVGRHKERLASFELALRKAEIAEYNLIRVSSIFPPGCHVISKRLGLSREMNTILSKSPLPAISELAVEGKTEIEKIREQVQNVE